MSERPLLVCLLPVRNGEQDLPGYLEAVRPWVDAVVALDDGSTDGTRGILERDPLVATVLTNPVRPSWHGWDDGENRSRLLEAAGWLRPRWVISLDVDEWIEPDEGVALREFLEAGALPGLAYSFRLQRTWDSRDRVEVPGWWVVRLFAWEPGQSFPRRRLHFEPVPVEIPRQRRARLAVRIRHLAGASAGRRAERVAKYEEVDPDRSWGFAYPDLTEDVTTSEWEPWVAGTPVLLPAGGAEPETAGAGAGDDDVVLSAVVISRDDGPRILPAVRSVVAQETSEPFEVIVVTSGSGGAADLVRAEFPDVVVVELPEPALPGAARNAGLRVARGEYISFPGSHVELPPGSLEARIRAHDAGYTMVTGTTLNGTDTPAGWASYVLDHAEVLPGRPSEDLPGAPAHCSYVRRALVRVGGFPEDLRAGEDTVVNQRLAALGFRARRAQDVHLVHHTRCRTPSVLLRHHFTRGRAYGQILLDEHRVDGRLLGTRGPRRQHEVQVRRRVRTIDVAVGRWGDDELRRRYAAVRPLVVATAWTHWLGTCVELARPAPGRWFVLAGRPVVTVEATVDGAPATVRTDAVSRRVHVVRWADPPPDVEVDGRSPWPSPSRRPALLSLLRRQGTGLDGASRLSLLWSRLRVPAQRVHHVDASARDTGAAEVTRLLDTRSGAERARDGLDLRARR